MASLESKRKRKRESRSDSKRKKKEKNEPERDQKDGNKYKSLIQLAKLVQGGKLIVPKSLESYVEDNAILIDQLFTILTQKDIEGMLPDILKRCKLRHIKELCMNELKKMSEEDIKLVLSGQGEGLKPEVGEDGRGGDDVWDGRGVGVSEMHLSDVSNEDNGSMNDGSHDQGVDKKPRVCERPLDSDGRSSPHPMSHDPSSENEEEEPLIRVSIDSEDDIELTVGSDDVLSDTGNSEWIRDITESQKLLEIQLRNRILERKLSTSCSTVEEHVNATSCVTTTTDATSDATTGDVTTGVTTGIVKDNTVTDGSNVDMLELKLRQRALQSLLLNKSQLYNNN